MSARAFGFDAEVRWRPAGDVAADVTLLSGPAPPDEVAKGRLRALRRREMNRSRYRADPVPGSVIEGLQATAGRLGFSLSVLTDRAEIDRVAAIAARASAMKLMHGPTQAELYSLMRFSAKAAAQHRDGLDLELFFTPAVATRFGAAAMHPRVLGALAPFGMAQGLAEKLARDTEEDPLRSAPALCLLQAGSLEDETFLRGGACFEEIALDITEAGLAMALAQRADRRGRPVLPHPGRCRHPFPGALQRRAARQHRRGAPRAADGVRRTAGRADRIFPARVADQRSPGAGASPVAPASRVWPEPAHDRETTACNQPSLSRKEQSCRCAPCGSWLRAAAASAGRRSCRWCGWARSGLCPVRAG